VCGGGVKGGRALKLSLMLIVMGPGLMCGHCATQRHSLENCVA